MRQKYAVTIADVHMNISCDESQETINEAVTTLDEKIHSLLSSAGSGCTKTEAALLLALDYCTRCSHAENRIRELEEYVSTADPNGDNFGASLLRGENETLRAELQVSRGTNDALLQDNATLFQLHTKSEKQSADANARADRMHNQVLALMSEVQSLRGKLAASCVETHDLPENFGVAEPIPQMELTGAEQEVTRRYEQMDIDKILQTAPSAESTLRRAAEHGDPSDGGNGVQ